jgi:hypothetical protein
MGKPLLVIGFFFKKNCSIWVNSLIFFFDGSSFRRLFLADTRVYIGHEHPHIIKWTAGANDHINQTDFFFYYEMFCGCKGKNNRT